MSKGNMTSMNSTRRASSTSKCGASRPARQAKKKAEAETYGTVKLLRDTDGDGVMDKAIVWADRLPPCYGIAAANGGLIVACAPHIVFLKDSDGDDKADVNEKLFSGFGTGNLERGINAPTLGPDGWSTWAAAGPVAKSPGRIWQSPSRFLPRTSASARMAAPSSL
jgi:glucose/arabinose dehydrogenase